MIVVDTNIIFSALVSKNSSIFDLLTSKNEHFIIPKFVIVELFKHKDKIRKFSKHSDEEMLSVLYVLLKNIDIYNEELISKESLKDGYEIVKDVDEKDMIL
ncbi:MAG: PIN domain-containing protein [Campylobacterales bacterium]